MIAATSLAAALLWGSVLVEGATSCPTPADVEALVLQGNGPGRRGDRAELIISDGRLRVRLLDRTGNPVNERELALDAPCSGLAAAAAAVIEAMELELRSSPEVDIGAAGTGAGATRGSGATKGAGVTMVAGATTGAEVGTGAGATLSYAVGAMFLESIADDALAPGAALTLSLGSSKSGFRLETGLFVEARRQLAFDGGTASYQRFWLSLGPGYAVKWRHFTFEGELVALGGLVWSGGDGTTSPGSGTALEVGGALGLTGQWSFGAFAISTGPLLLLWPEGTNVEIVSLHQSRALPVWDGLWSLGVRFGSG